MPAFADSTKEDKNTDNVPINKNHFSIVLRRHIIFIAHEHTSFYIILKINIKFLYTLFQNICFKLKNRVECWTTWKLNTDFVENALFIVRYS